MQLEQEDNMNRDFIGFILFLFIITGVFYAIYSKASSISYFCLLGISVVVLIYWLNPTIKELAIRYKKNSIKVKQHKKR